MFVFKYKASRGWVLNDFAIRDKKSRSVCCRIERQGKTKQTGFLRVSHLLQAKPGEPHFTQQGGQEIVPYRSQTRSF